MSPRAALLLLAGLATALALMARRAPRAAPAAVPAYPKVRDAGRSQMRIPPRHWDLQDETVDESFPASDPPGNY